MNAVEEFLRAGGSVCPFARATSGFLFAEVGEYPSVDRATFMDVVWRFSKSVGMVPYPALILVSSKPGMDYERSKRWAIDTYLEVNVAAVCVADPRITPNQAEDLIYKEVKPVLMNDADLRRPNIVLYGQRVVTICMSPNYPKTHPRYAPQTCLVLTWNMDILRGQMVAGVVQKVRATMQKEHGSVYDADELMLKLPRKR